MTRELTRDELQRCIDKANEIVGEEPAEDDAVIALECLTNPREDDSAWAYVVTTEAARILAGDVDAREVEIAALRQDLALAGIREQGVRETLAQCEGALAERDAEVERLRERLVMVEAERDARLVAAIEKARASIDADAAETKKEGK